MSYTNEIRTYRTVSDLRVEREHTPLPMWRQHAILTGSGHWFSTAVRDWNMQTRSKSTVTAFAKIHSQN